MLHEGLFSNDTPTGCLVTVVTSSALETVCSRRSRHLEHRHTNKLPDKDTLCSVKLYNHGEGPY